MYKYLIQILIVTVLTKLIPPKGQNILNSNRGRPKNYLAEFADVSWKPVLIFSDGTQSTSRPNPAEAVTPSELR